MKQLSILFILVPFLLFGINEKPKQSKIEKVTVYLEGATIERVSSVTLTPGENTLLFNNLSPDIDENSIQISGLNNASITALNYTINYLEKKPLSEEYNQLKIALEKSNFEKNGIQNSILGLEEELQLLKRNQRINSDATDLSLEKVKEMSIYYRNRVTEIKNTIFKLQFNMVVVINKINDLTNEMLKLDDLKKEKRGEIVVKLDAKSATNLVLQIKYNVNNAGWFPLYDIKAISTSEPINISYKANIYQQSGNDWEDVAVILSTGDPTTNNLKPIMLPKRLNFSARVSNATPVRRHGYKYNPSISRVSGLTMDNSGLPLPGVNVIEKGTSNGTQTDFDGNYSLEIDGGRELTYSYVGFKTENLPIYAGTMNVQMEEDSAKLEEVVVTGYARNSKELYRTLQGKSKGIVINDGLTGSSENISFLESELDYTKETGLTATRFEISKRYTIKSNSEITVIEIDSFNLTAVYKHYAAPELNENVFLTATIKDWEQFDFLQGEANVYFEGNYTGKSYINPQATTDSLSLSLGIDPNIIINRKKLENFKSKSFLGGTRIIDKGYSIEVKNNKKNSVNIVIEDRIPVSQNKEIKVSDIKTGNAIYKTKTGILRWNLILSPNENRKKEFSYTVKYPKYKHINL